MVDVETLEVVIDVIDQFTEDLQRLSAELGQVDAQAESVEDEDIDIDVQGESEILSAIALLEALDMAKMKADRGDIDLNVDREGGMMRGGGGVAGTVTPAMARSLEVSELSKMLNVDEDLAKKFRNLSESMGESEHAFDILNLRMSDIHNIFASLIPLLAVFVGALPAAIAGLAALYAAAGAAAISLGAIAGLSIFGVAMDDARNMQEAMQNLKDTFNEIKNSFIEAFAPLAERFDDVGKAMISGFEDLFNAIARQSGPLVELKDEAMAFGAFLVDLIPDVIAGAARMAEAFAPVFSVFGRLIKEIDWVEVFSSIAVQVLPILMSLGKTLMGLMPAIIQVSIGFLKIVNAIVTLIDTVATALSILHIPADIFGLVAATGLVLITVLIWVAKIYALLTGEALAAAVANSSLSLSFSGLISTVWGAIVSLAAWMAELISINTVIPATIAYVGALTISVLTFAAALAVATLGISALLGGMAAAGTQAGATSGKFKKLRREANKLGDVGSGMETDFGGMSGPDLDGFGKQATSGAERATEAMKGLESAARDAEKQIKSTGDAVASLEGDKAEVAVNASKGDLGMDKAFEDRKAQTTTNVTRLAEGAEELRETAEREEQTAREAQKVEKREEKKETRKKSKQVNKMNVNIKGAENDREIKKVMETSMYRLTKNSSKEK